MQVIELELPNLHTKEDQANRHRVRMHSRDRNSSHVSDQELDEAMQDNYQTKLDGGHAKDSKNNDDDNENFDATGTHTDKSSITSYMKPTPMYPENKRKLKKKASSKQPAKTDQQ